MKNKKTIKNPIANVREENGILHSLDRNGRNIIYNDYYGDWVRIDELIWHYFGNEKQNGREIIHIDGNNRNDRIDNLKLK